MKNSRDIHGDGHGFVDVPVGRKPAPAYRYNYDLTRIPMGNEPFLGLYNANGVKRSVIIWRAAKPTEGLRFLTLEGSPHPHYMPDPIAWSELPTP